MWNCVIHKLLISFCCLFLIAKIYSRKDKRILPDVNFIFQFPKRPLSFIAPKEGFYCSVSFQTGFFPWLEGVFECSFFFPQVSSLLTLCIKCIFDHNLDWWNELFYIWILSFFPIFWEAVFVFIWAMRRQTMLGNQSRNLTCRMIRKKIWIS